MLRQLQRESFLQRRREQAEGETRCVIASAAAPKIDIVQPTENEPESELSGEELLEYLLKDDDVAVPENKQAAPPPAPRSKKWGRNVLSTEEHPRSSREPEKRPWWCVPEGAKCWLCKGESAAARCSGCERVFCAHTVLCYMCNASASVPASSSSAHGREVPPSNGDEPPPSPPTPNTTPESEDIRSRACVVCGARGFFTTCHGCKKPACGLGPRTGPRCMEPCMYCRNYLCPSCHNYLCPSCLGCGLR